MATPDLSTIPLAPNPNGDPPNFSNPPSQASTILDVGIPFAVLCVVVVAFRLTINFRIVRKLYLDDYLCLVAFLLMIAYYGLLISCEPTSLRSASEDTDMTLFVIRNTARHIYDVPVSFIDASYVKRQFAVNMMLRYGSYAGLTLTFLLYWVETPLSIAFCAPPLHGAWDFAALSKCGEIAVMGPIHGATGVVADLLLLVLPFPILATLNLAPRKKVGLAIVFMTGILTTITTVISLYYRTLIYTNEDKFWYAAKVDSLVAVEGYTTIIVSCAPAMSLFWNKIFTKSALYSKLSSRNALAFPSSRQSRSGGGVVGGGYDGGYGGGYGGSTKKFGDAYVKTTARSTESDVELVGAHGGADDPELASPTRSARPQAPARSVPPPSYYFDGREARDPVGRGQIVKSTTIQQVTTLYQKGDSGSLR
ncbi:hypothetical protein MMC25_003819 [Agyrium rufum]|nr:hypothetical protein [Agyrium rufum]